ncbi:hypothetical protein M2302_001056 [Micromonospora sp. A200]|uniref:hypothetical protein n=1 Tax=Micromonospora sp. A200 TaxID=2940568 RepID=UPI002473D8A7|nr:hypothetical protein [Micromonospora sp. A200]MDH6460890.1 hypothetical protein [Micromonospora sp. A200]
MTIGQLIGRGRAAGLRLEMQGGQLTIRGPREAGDLARALLARRPEVISHLTGATCCGQRATGTAGAPLVNACQLCPTSPTYWRDQPPSPAPPQQTAAPATAQPERTGSGLVWSSHATGDPAPCRICRRPALMRDGEGRPCHKVCAEQADQTTEGARP